MEYNGSYNEPSEYNETLVVDLHELEPGIFTLSITLQGSVLKIKLAEIVNSFTHTTIHANPQRLYRDNGGELNKKEIRDMAKNFNVERRTTAAYSP